MPRCGKEHQLGDIIALFFCAFLVGGWLMMQAEWFE